MLVRIWRDWSLVLCKQECEMEPALWRTAWQLLKEGNDPAIRLLGIHSKELKAESQADTCTLRFTAVLFKTVKR